MIWQTFRGATCFGREMPLWRRPTIAKHVELLGPSANPPECLVLLIQANTETSSERLYHRIH